MAGGGLGAGDNHSDRDHFIELQPLFAGVHPGDRPAEDETLTNYHSFVKQVLMKENESGTTIAWLLDNAHVGDDGRIQELTNDLSTKIEVLIATYNNERTDVTENERIEN